MAEKIILTEYSDEMQQSYINYSMSVITSRAVPDIRDGLKPVQRRVLYAMHTLGLNADKPHKKSARIVGDAMGKYHPHGDSSIYEALVVLSQDFKKGMALVDGHGNFGSIEGDGAAAMRYTEARLRKFTQDVYLSDIDKNTVDFVPNYDETDKEPSVLPVRVPNFLLNGSDGIAVGMTTSAPPHNLAELLDATIYFLDHPDATVPELMQYLPGPDFPTGGIVINQSELREIYETGKGKIKIRGKAEFIKAQKRGEKDRIEITEIPYTMIGAAIGKFLQDTAELVEKKVFPDITDILNQSKEGIKIVLELRSGADGDKILQGLYKKTKLEDTFGVNMLCIADGKPEVLGLRGILSEYVKFQIQLTQRKYTTLLEKAEKKKEVQEGLIHAVDVIDTIIEVLRGSKKLETVKECLMTGKTDGIRFKSENAKTKAAKLCFTEAQTLAILAMPLQKLIGLEVLALQKEYEETVLRIQNYRKILSSDNEMKKVIAADLTEIRQKYSVPRRTVLADEEEAVFTEEPEVIQPVLFTMNRFGYTKCYDMAYYEKNREAIDAEAETRLYTMSNARILLFTDTGNCHQLRMKDVPYSKMKDKGVPVDNITNYRSADERILYMEDLEKVKEKTLLFATKYAMIKQVEGAEFDSVKKTIASTKLSEGDALISVSELLGSDTALVTKNHLILRFKSEEISLYKKTSVGVRGLKLEPEDEVEAIYDFDDDMKFSVKVGNKRVDLTTVKLKKRDAKPEKIK